MDFRNTIIIMTSNVGSDLIRRESAIGFSTVNDEEQSEKQRYEKMKDKVLQEMKRVFRARVPPTCGRYHARLPPRSAGRTSARSWT